MTYDPPQRPAGIPPYQHPQGQYQYPQGHQPPPGYQPAPPAPPKKGGALKVVAIVAGVFLVLCVGGGIIAALQGDTGATTAPDAGDAAPAAAANAEVTEKAKAPAPKKKQQQQQPGLGDPVRDGKFEFTVTDLDCSKKKLGDQYLNKKAQGKFCVVALTVKNIGDKAQMFSGTTQKAYDGTGAEYTNDGAAEFYANANAETFLNDINPGNKVSGKIVFDVPAAVTLTSLELHDSFWSGGVKVSLE